MSDIAASRLTPQQQVDQAQKSAWALLRQIDEQLEDYNPSLWADLLGMAFYNATGIWPTFKSAPIGMYHRLTDEQRQAAFKEWVEAVRDRRTNHISDLLNTSVGE